MVVNHDESQMKINSGNNKIGLMNVMVMCCSISTMGGKRVDFMPALSNLPRKTALNIYAGLRLDELDFPVFCRGPNAWKYVVFGHDSASANILCNRYLAAELDSFPR